MPESKHKPEKYEGYELYYSDDGDLLCTVTRDMKELEIVCDACNKKGLFDYDWWHIPMDEDEDDDDEEYIPDREFTNIILS